MLQNDSKGVQVLVTKNGDTFTGRFWSPQLTRPRLNDDYSEAWKSLQRLKELGSVKMLPGHGRPWQGEISEAIALALAG